MKPDLFDQRPIVLLVLLTVLFYWQLALTDQFTFLDSPDQAFQVLPWYQMQARAWHQGYFPMWDPYQWAGQPLLGQMQPGAAFPLNWPLFRAPLTEKGRINQQYIHWHYVLMHVLAALFMYAFLRQLGRSRYASLLAGLAFACAGYVGSVPWPQMLHGAMWIPLIFLLFHRFAEARRWQGALTWTVLCGGAIGFALLSGHHQTPLFTLLALTGLFLYFFLHRARQSRARAAGLGGLYLLVAVFAFLVGALQLFPAVEYAREAYRWVGAAEPVGIEKTVPYFVQYESRLHPSALLGLTIPNAHFGVNTFVGWFCLAMGAYGVVLCWSSRWVRVYACLAVGALAYSFGPLSLFHGWVYALVPYADKARTPAHAVFVFQFALLILTAHGIDRLLDTSADDTASLYWLTHFRRVLLGFALIASLFVFYRFVSQQWSALPGDQVMIAVLAALALVVLFHAQGRGLFSRPGLRVSFLALMLFELGSVKWLDLSHREAPAAPKFLETLAERNRLADFLHRQPRPFRFEMTNEEGNINLGDWAGLEAVDGYLASVSRDLFDFFAPDWEKRKLLLNTVYTVAKERTREEQIEIFSDPSGWKVFRNPDAYPRAWVAHDTAHISAPAGSAGLNFSPESCEGDETVTIRRQTIHRVLADVRLACPGYVIFGDPYFAGWEADIDGYPAPVFRAYNALRALALPAGSHTVEFVYRPRSVYWGGALTAAGLLACLLAAGIGAWRGEFRPRGDLSDRDL